MSEPAIHDDSTLDAAQPPRGPTTRVGVVLALGAVALLTAMVAMYYWYYPSRIGPAQPIPFSHRFHAGEKQISCLFCHPGALDSARAGVPPLETCMLCHQRIIINYPQIQDLRQHYAQSRPVEWVKVTYLPEFVYFDHQRHVRHGFDCNRCHGNVKSMDRIYLWQDMTMGFCVQCHRDNNYSHDCTVCHR